MTARAMEAAVFGLSCSRFVSLRHSAFLLLAERIRDLVQFVVFSDKAAALAERDLRTRCVWSTL